MVSVELLVVTVVSSVNSCVASVELLGVTVLVAFVSISVLVSLLGIISMVSINSGMHEITTFFKR